MCVPISGWLQVAGMCRSLVQMRVVKRSIDSDATWLVELVSHSETQTCLPRISIDVVVVVLVLLLHVKDALV